MYSMLFQLFIFLHTFVWQLTLWKGYEIFTCRFHVYSHTWIILKHIYVNNNCNKRGKEEKVRGYLFINGYIEILVTSKHFNLKFLYAYVQEKLMQKSLKSRILFIECCTPRPVSKFRAVFLSVIFSLDVSSTLLSACTWHMSLCLTK